MNDRTSYSYRATLPGGTPDMHKNGGMSRDEFKRVRCSPYIREHSQGQTRDGDEGGGGHHPQTKHSRKRRAPAPTLNPRF